MALVTQQQFEDASRDADDLGKVVNGAADLNGTGLVATRTGGSVKTLAKLFADLEGKLPAIAYVTETALLADLVPADKVLAYALDTNKYYVKNGATGAGGWTTGPSAARTAPNILFDSFNEYTADTSLRLLGGWSWYAGSGAFTTTTTSANIPYPTPVLVSAGGTVQFRKVWDVTKLPLKAGDVMTLSLLGYASGAAGLAIDLYFRNNADTNLASATGIVSAGSGLKILSGQMTVPAGATKLLVVARTANTTAASFEVGGIFASIGTSPPALVRAGHHLPHILSWMDATNLNSRFAAAKKAGKDELDAVAPLGKNLFNPADPDVKLGFFINFSTGIPTANASYNASGFIPVTPGETYTISFSHQRAFYDANQNYVSGTNGTEATLGATFTVPAGCYYLRSGCSTGSWSTFQVEAGSSKTAFEAYGRTIDEDALPPLSGDSLADDSIPIAKLTPLDKAKNLFNPDDPDVQSGYYVKWNNGTIAANALYAVTGFVPIEEGEEYTLSYSHQRAFYTAAKAYISGTNSGNPATFTAPAGAAFARFTMPVGGVGAFQVERGDTATVYEAYYSPRIPFESLPPSIEFVGARLDGTTTTDGAPLWNPYRPELLRHCRYRLMKRLLGESAQLVISAAGDSFTHNTSRWIGPFTSYLTAKYGDAGGGWSGFGFAISAGQSGPWSAGNQPSFKQGNARPTTYPMTLYGLLTSTYSSTASASPDLATVTMTQAGDYITQAIPALPVHNGCDLVFIGTADGVIRYRWGSGSWTTVNVQGTVNQAQKVALNTGLPSGAGTLTVEWVAGVVKLCGVNLLSTADGVRVNKLACTGSNIAQWANAPADEWERALGHLGHHMFIYMDGTNSQAGNMGRDTWGGHLDTIVSRVRAATPGLDVLIATPPENQRGFATSMTVYATEARNRAHAGRFTFNDMQDVFGDPFDPGEYAFDGDLPLFNSDLTHPEPATGGRSLTVEFLKCVEPL